MTVGLIFTLFLVSLNKKIASVEQGLVRNEEEARHVA